MKLGVHAVSEGVESLLDARECSLGNEESHLCNLYDDFSRVQVGKLSGVFLIVCWTRGCSVTDHNIDVHGIDENDADCHYDWLVKWTGLDYSHATWELENASFLRSPEGSQTHD
ncbi:hypothetical protein HAX54_046629 [Datura stramonium]|uniref:Chromo domain-containing protein n=1 Tax=Datura stramonium TaxID=4076 RepID=A0ABS8WL37_DATST|nr:hypothetical protein [Datura stramonium]